MINGIAFVIGMLLLGLALDNGLTNIANALSERKDFKE